MEIVIVMVGVLERFKVLLYFAEMLFDWEVMPSVITVVEPKKHITGLWGRQSIKESATYRLMKYVLRVNHDGKVLLYNIVTEHLVVLDNDESEMLDSLPMDFNPWMKDLIYGYFLVTQKYDEHRDVLNIRNILLKVNKVYESDEGITQYTILPTTQCNARCFYCFEKNVKTETMTVDIAEDVVAFIVNNCKQNPVRILWFGGEPTVGAKYIDLICRGLSRRDIQYKSMMITNGYLFDNELILKAKELWNIDLISITVDGVGESYNRIKNYKAASDDPYERVMRNIGLLLKNEIQVILRMNFDQDNYQEFDNLVSEVGNRFGKNSYLSVSAHEIDHRFTNQGCNTKFDALWFSQKLIELDNIANAVNINTSNTRLPCLRYQWCMANNSSCITITPAGNLVSCPEQLGSDQIKGNINSGVTEDNIVSSWREIYDGEECQNCCLFPDCFCPRNCLGSGKCFHKDIKMKKYLQSLTDLYDSYNNMGGTL